MSKTTLPVFQGQSLAISGTLITQKCARCKDEAWLMEDGECVRCWRLVVLLPAVIDEMAEDHAKESGWSINDVLAQKGTPDGR